MSLERKTYKDTCYNIYGSDKLEATEIANRELFNICLYGGILIIKYNKT